MTTKQSIFPWLDYWSWLQLFWGEGGREEGGRMPSNSRQTRRSVRSESVGVYHDEFDDDDTYEISPPS